MTSECEHTRLHIHTNRQHTLIYSDTHMHYLYIHAYTHTRTLQMYVTYIYACIDKRTYQVTSEGRLDSDSCPLFSSNATIEERTAIASEPDNGGCGLRSCHGCLSCGGSCCSHSHSMLALLLITIPTSIFQAHLRPVCISLPSLAFWPPEAPSPSLLLLLPQTPTIGE